MYKIEIWKDNTTKIIETIEDWCSGDKISKKLNLSISKLKSMGYVIEARKGKGYKLISKPEISIYEIASILKKNNINLVREIYYFKEIDSTNEFAKKIGKANALIFAETQTAGKGRLGISTLGAVVYLQMGMELSLPPTDPVKIVGNLGFIALFAGTTWVIFKRFSDPEKLGLGSYFDWFFVIILYLVAITGIAIELARLAGSVAAYYIYLVHLVFVFTLLTYAPYSKFAHLLYRAIAYVYSESTGRKAEKTVEKT